MEGKKFFAPFEQIKYEFCNSWGILLVHYGHFVNDMPSVACWLGWWLRMTSTQICLMLCSQLILQLSRKQVSCRFSDWKAASPLMILMCLIFERVDLQQLLMHVSQKRCHSSILGIDRCAKINIGHLVLFSSRH